MRLHRITIEQTYTLCLYFTYWRRIFCQCDSQHLFWLFLSFVSFLFRSFKSFHFSTNWIESIDWQVQEKQTKKLNCCTFFFIHCVRIKTRNDSTTTTRCARPCPWSKWPRKSIDFAWGFLKRKIPQHGIERYYSACVRICMRSRRFKIYPIEIGRCHRVAEIVDFSWNAADFTCAHDWPIRQLYCAKVHRNRQQRATPMDFISRWIRFDDFGHTQIRLPCRSTGDRIRRDVLQSRTWHFATILWIEHRCIGSRWAWKSRGSIFIPFGIGSDPGKENQWNYVQS